MESENRRPLAVRRLALMQGMAARLARRGVTPNALSGASMGWAALGCGAFAAAPMLGPVAGSLALVLAALAIQARLLCNLFDGMVAVEGGRATPAGAFWNEAPDRVSDALFFWGAGLAAGRPALGLGVAVLALGTAWLREFGRAEGFAPDFGGPMAKQQRMAALTLGALAAAWTGVWVLMPVLALVAAGSVLTVVLRARRVLAALEGRSGGCAPPEPPRQRGVHPPLETPRVFGAR